MTAYCVHARDEAIARPHRLEANGHIDAALAYAERWLGDEAQPVTLLIEDEATGEEYCLTLDLATGATRDCG